MNSRQNKTLLDYLAEVEDPRRAAGRRHELPFIFLIIIMSVMSGCFSLRAMRDFIKKNKQDLLENFHPEHNRLPSHQTIGRTLQKTDFEKLSAAFQSWATAFVSIEEKTWVALDGKAICGTLEDSGTEFQNFTSLVTAFAVHSKQSLAAGKLSTKKENEIPTAKELIESLGLKKMRLHAGRPALSEENGRSHH